MLNNMGFTMNNLSAAYESSDKDQFHKREEIRKLVIAEMIKNINDKISKDYDSFKKLVRQVSGDKLR